jgi:predicted secreted protein
MVTFTEKDVGRRPEIAAGSRFAIQLAENPTTGYRWNASTTAGLEILSTDYVGNAHPEGMTGVGGIRTWVLITTEPGDPSFTTVYQRSWEHATGNETVFKLTLHAVPV